MPTFIASEGEDFVVQYTSRKYNSALPAEALKVDGTTGAVTVNGVAVDTGAIVDSTARAAAAAAQSTADGAVSVNTTQTTNITTAQATADETTLAAGTNLGNVDATIAVAGGSQYTLPGPTTLTADHTITLSPTGATAGEEIVIIRNDATANQLIIVNGGPGAGTVYTFPVSVKRILAVVFDGTNWGTPTHAKKR